MLGILPLYTANTTHEAKSDYTEAIDGSEEKRAIYVRWSYLSNKEIEDATDLDESKNAYNLVPFGNNRLLKKAYRKCDFFSRIEIIEAGDNIQKLEIACYHALYGSSSQISAIVRLINLYTKVDQIYEIMKLGYPNKKIRQIGDDKINWLQEE